MDLSLDDIIQKKYSKNRTGRGRGRGQTKRLETGGDKTRGYVTHVNTKRGGIRGRRGNYKPQINDARLKIIQNNRSKLTDARDKLAQIAKQSDARDKLDKLRNSKIKGIRGGKRTLGRGGITMQTGRNGRIALTTNRNQGGPLLRTTTNDQNAAISLNRGFKSPSLRLPHSSNDNMDEDDEMLSSGPLRRTVTNDISSPPPLPVFSPPVQRSLYTWVNSMPQERQKATENFVGMQQNPLRAPILRNTSSVSRHLTQPTNLKIVARNSIQKSNDVVMSNRAEWNYKPLPARRHAISRMDLDSPPDEDMPMWNNEAMTGRMSSELMARLDTNPLIPRTMGILSPAPKPPVSLPSPMGHRIVVSNLQPSVTHEDIRELFEDVGPLVTSRVVRAGTAEVVYQLHKDAVKAVDIYHNRQLDGQPMKCMLVNSRPLTTTKNMTGLRPSSSSFKLPTGGKSSVIPDMGTIYKALFDRKP